MTDVHNHQSTVSAERGYSAGVHANDRRMASPLDVVALILAAAVIWGPLAAGAFRG